MKHTIKNRIILFEAISTITGTIIGAGILAIPYVIVKAGFWTGSLVLLIVGAAMLLLKLMYGEASLRTSGNHQICGYTEIYLGKPIKYIMSFILIASIYGGLLAYFIGGGEVIEAIIGIPAMWGSLGFYIIFSILIYIGLAVIKRTELIMAGFIFVAMLFIAVLSFSHIDFSNLVGFDWGKLAVPYGVLLFASSGLIAIPEARLILKRREKLMKSAILWGCSIPPIVYFLFSALIISVSGIKVTEIASVGLGNLLGWKMILAANIFAFFSIATSFLTSGLALKEIYQFDYKLPSWVAWLLTVVVPLIVFFMGARDFVKVVGVVGSVGVGIAGILYVFTYFRARKIGTRKPEYEIPVWLGFGGGWFIIILFVLGLIYTIVNL